MASKYFIVIIYICFTSGDAIDYCNLPCKVGLEEVENSACNCNFGSECGANVKLFPPDEETKNFIVELHNFYRERVASGEFTTLQPASNIAALVYDDELQHVAQCFANKCKPGHDDCRRTEKFPLVGQNSYNKIGEACDKENLFKLAISSWFDEFKEVSEECVKSFSNCAGHFTQMLWAETTHIGCGGTSFGNSCLAICNYGPAGNIWGKSVYKEGQPSCETDEKYPHLCRTLLVGDESSARNATLTKLLCIFTLFVGTYYLL